MTDPRADTIRAALAALRDASEGWPLPNRYYDAFVEGDAAVTGLLADAAEQRERADLWFDIAKEREARLASAEAAWDSVANAIENGEPVDVTLRRRAEAAEARVAALEADLRDARYLGDNHHNAAACPHCGDLLGRERGRVAALQTDLAGVISLARHLWAMIPQHVWRAGGGDDGQGHYEGDYHAESVREQLDAFAARAALAASAPDTQQETK